MVKSKILDEPVNKTLFSLAMPISLGMLSTFLFQAIDTFFVGKLGSESLAALSFASTVFFLMMGLYIGLSIGVSAIVGKSIGEKNKVKTQRFVTLSILLTGIVSVLVSILGIYTIEPLFKLLGADLMLIPLISDYMKVLYLTIPFLIVAIVSNGALRATGESGKPELIMGLGGVVNLVFDYLLIFGNGPFSAYGFKGAAMASGASFVFIFVFSMMLLYSKKIFSLKSITNMKENIISLKHIFEISTPSIGTQLLTPISGSFIIFILAKFGTDVVAAYGVAMRIEALALVGLMGVSAALVPFIAQNYGAKKCSRVDEAIVFAGKASKRIGIVLFLILFIFGRYIVQVFTSDEKLIEIAVMYFRIVSISYILHGLLSVSTSIFNGNGHPKRALRIILVKAIIFTIPLIYIASFFGAYYVFLSLAIVNILAGLYAARTMRKYLREVGSNLEDRSIFYYLFRIRESK